MVMCSSGPLHLRTHMTGTEKPSDGEFVELTEAEAQMRVDDGDKEDAEEENASPMCYLVFFTKVCSVSRLSKSSFSPRCHVYSPWPILSSKSLHL